MVDDKKNIFQSQKEDLTDKADKGSNRTYSVIKRSCNKMLVRKDVLEKRNAAIGALWDGINRLHPERDK